MSIIDLFRKRPERGGRRWHGECQRCKRTDYLPWATEDGEFYCGWCHEKGALDYARHRGWTPPKGGPDFRSPREQLAYLLWCQSPRIEKLWIPDSTAPYDDAVKWNDEAALQIADALLAEMSAAFPDAMIATEGGTKA